MKAQIEKLRQEDLIDELRSVLSVTSNWMAIPLFLAFWIADIFYVPQFKWQFLLIRLTIIPLCIGVNRFARISNEVTKLRATAILYTCVAAFGINLMIYFIPDPATCYYAGLGLISIGGLGFVPFSRKEFVAVGVGIYGPYYTIVLSKCHSRDEYLGVLLNSFFLLSSMVVCFLIRFFQEGVRLKEIEARVMLSEEVNNRDELIRVKTEEAVRLNALSAQFSPQVVNSIREGKIKIENGGKRAQICAIFIDIVNSTERVTRIDKDKVEKVLSKFLDESIKILLKYDITIDKFLGDGILGFCNAPLERVDYVERVINAALEIRENIKKEQDFFEKYWMKPLDIRVGIAKGFATVGFYGSQKYYRSYTAIGPVVNLASRLCSSAESNQILIDYDIFEGVGEQFETRFIDKRTLKGFEQDIIHTYEVISSKKIENMTPDMNECPTCGSILSLETNERGQYIFMCKSCCQVVDTTTKSATKAA